MVVVGFVVHAATIRARSASAPSPVREVTARHAEPHEARVAAAVAWRRLARRRPTPLASSRRDIALSARISARFKCAHGGGYGGDDSRSLGVSAVASEVSAQGTRSQTGLGSRRRLLGVGWLDAGRRRSQIRDAIIALSDRFSAPFECALVGGYGGDDSRSLGVSAVASEVTARHEEPNGARVAAAAAWRRLA